MLTHRTLAALAALATALLTADVAAAHWKPSVGHRVEKSVIVTGTPMAEPRSVDVHLWYPADPKSAARSPRTDYASALHGVPLIPDDWDPLAWSVKADLAREDAQIEHGGKRLRVIVFSHGAANDPIDYAHTLELIAAAGFVVAAPTHVNNTQDDVRRTYINNQAGFELLPCRDGRPTPCARGTLSFSMADRVRDVAAVLDGLPRWLGPRADVSRAGVMGHSRGTVTALAAAGGSSPRSTPEANCQGQPPTAALCWPLVPDPRVAAVMGLAIGAEPVIRGVDLANVKVPALFVAGGRDQITPPANSEFALEQISSRRKALVVLDDATHRSYDSTYCDQVQAAGAIAADHPRSILDRHTFDGIARPVPAGGAADFCDYKTFTKPVDIRGLVEPMVGFEITRHSVPSTGLDVDQVKWRMAALAVLFFGTAL